MSTTKLCRACGKPFQPGRWDANPNVCYPCSTNELACMAEPQPARPATRMEQLLELERLACLLDDANLGRLIEQARRGK